jgi:hypothetical protein
MMIGLGIALLSLLGFGGGPPMWIDETAFALVFAGAVLGGLVPLPGRA